MWQDLTGESSSVCIEVRLTQSATMIPIFFVYIQSTHTHTPGQDMTLIVFQDKGNLFITVKSTPINI